MSELGQSRRFAPPLTTSGLPSIADITHRDHHFRKVPNNRRSFHKSEQVILPVPRFLLYSPQGPSRERAAPAHCGVSRGRSPF
jgi:hypothetical protein